MLRHKCAQCGKGTVDPVSFRCDACGHTSPVSNPFGKPPTLTALPRFTAAQLPEVGGGDFDPEKDVFSGTLTSVTGVGALGFHGVPRKVDGVNVSALGLSTFERFLLSLVDGTTLVDDIVASSGLPVLDAARAFHRLKELGAVRFFNALELDAPPPPPAARISSVPTPIDLPAAVPLPVAADPAADLALHVAAARRLLDEGDPVQARREIAHAARAGVPSSELDALRDALDNPARAEERALKLHKLAETAERSQRVRDAVMFYRRAITEHDELAVAHFGLGVLMLKAAGASPEVEKHLARAHALDADNLIYNTMLQRVRSFLEKRPGN